jgi:acyl carrier protein
MAATLAEQLTDVFRDVFGDDDLVVTDETTSNDVPGWDSLANINLLFALEESFAVHFPDEVFSDFRNVGDLRRYLEERLPPS